MQQFVPSHNICYGKEDLIEGCHSLVMRAMVEVGILDIVNKSAPSAPSLENIKVLIKLAASTSSTERPC